MEIRKIKMSERKIIEEVSTAMKSYVVLEKYKEKRPCQYCGKECFDPEDKFWYLPIMPDFVWYECKECYNLSKKDENNQCSLS